MAIQRQSMEWKHTDSDKEKVPGTMVSKEGPAESLLRHERKPSLLISLKKVQL